MFLSGDCIQRNYIFCQSTLPHVNILQLQNACDFICRYSVVSDREAPISRVPILPSVVFVGLELAEAPENGLQQFHLRDPVFLQILPLQIEDRGELPQAFAFRAQYQVKVLEGIVSYHFFDLDNNCPILWGLGFRVHIVVQEMYAIVVRESCTV